MTELNRVIEMRLDEITANLKEQIKLSGYEGESLGAGLIIRRCLPTGEPG